MGKKTSYGKDVKGAEKRGTGGGARRKIASLMKKGWTQSKIGKRVGRSASTISQIHTGAIQDVPAGLAAKLRKI